MKKLLAMLLAALMLLTGCASGESGDGEDQAAGGAGDLETIDVVLDWYPNAVHAFLYEAEEKGYFAEEGLDVNILFPSNTSDPLTMTAAGRADIGFYYQEEPWLGMRDEEQIYDLLMGDCTDGISGTDSKPGILKAGVARAGLTPLLRKVLHATGRVAAETGLPIFCHHDPAIRNGGEILDLFGECGVPASRCRMVTSIARVMAPPGANA